MELLMQSVTLQTVKKGNFNDLLALQKLAGQADLPDTEELKKIGDTLVQIEKAARK